MADGRPGSRGDEDGQPQERESEQPAHLAPLYDSGPNPVSKERPERSVTCRRDGLGIDPGTAACGFGIVHESGDRLKAVDYGWWQTPATQRPELRLKTIFDGVRELIEEFDPHAVALEESFVGVDARTALSVGQARGAVLVAAALAGVECAEYAPTRVKQAVCGYGRAEKAQVQRMVMAILGLEAGARRPTTPPTRSPWRSATRWRRRSSPQADRGAGTSVRA